MPNSMHVIRACESSYLRLNSQKTRRKCANYASQIAMFILVTGKRSLERKYAREVNLISHLQVMSLERNSSAAGMAISFGIEAKTFFDCRSRA